MASIAGYGQYSRVCPWVYAGYAHGCMPGMTMVGMPVRTMVGMSVRTMVGGILGYMPSLVGILGYMPSLVYTLPVHPWVYHCPAVHGLVYTADTTAAQGGEKRPWAQGRETSLGEGHLSD